MNADTADARKVKKDTRGVGCKVIIMSNPTQLS